MYIARELREVGCEFADRHHTTTLYSIRKIEEMRRTDQALNRAITRVVDVVVPQTLTRIPKHDLRQVGWSKAVCHRQQHGDAKVKGVAQW